MNRQTRRRTGRIGGSIALCLCLAVLTPASARAQDAGQGWSTQVAHQDAYVRTLEMLDRNGYRITMVDRTFLNRIMVRAEKDGTRREIVISQATGLVLRDVLFGE